MWAGSPAPVEMEELGKGRCPGGVALRCPWECWVREAWPLSLLLSLCWSSQHLTLTALVSLVSQSVRHLLSQAFGSLFLSWEVSDQQIANTTLQNMEPET